MFESVESCVGHKAAHGTSSEEVIVGGTKIQHPKTEGSFWCNLDAELLLGDFQNYGATAVMLYLVTGTISASKHAFAFSLEPGFCSPAIKKGVEHTSTNTWRHQAVKSFQIIVGAVRGSSNIGTNPPMPAQFLVFALVFGELGPAGRILSNTIYGVY